MSLLPTLLKNVRVPLHIQRRFRRSKLLVSTPAGPLARWPSLQPQPWLRVPDEDQQADVAPERRVTVDPLRHPDFFNVRSMFSVTDLFEARVHLGHKRGRLQPHMAEYLVGERHGVCIFNLDRTAALLRAALNFTAHIASRRGIVLFVCKYSQHATLVERTARQCGEYAHCRAWQDGTFTESLQLYGGVTRLPDLVVALGTSASAVKQHPVVTEAAKMLIPLVGVVDSDSDPRLVTYPVPGNDDSPASMALYCRLFSDAVARGKQIAKLYEQTGGETAEQHQSDSDQSPEVEKEQRDGVELRES